MISARAVAGILSALVLSACAAGPAGRADLRAQIRVMQSDPAIAAFFAEEAAAAGVDKIILTDSTGMVQSYGAEAIGLTRYRGTGGTEITFNIARPDAATPQNIAHEIAHAVAYRNGCDNHGALWGRAHVAIAQRFERNFPGALWAGLPPTEAAAEEARLYPEETC